MQTPETDLTNLDARTLLSSEPFNLASPLEAESIFSALTKELNEKNTKSSEKDTVSNEQNIHLQEHANELAEQKKGIFHLRYLEYLNIWNAMCHILLIEET